MKEETVNDKKFKKKRSLLWISYHDRLQQRLTSEKKIETNTTKKVDGTRIEKNRQNKKENGE